MFDIGFPELLVVSIVALLVIGPEKLPETVRTIAMWVGRFKRSLANIRTEIENEIGADEIRRELRNESIMKELNAAKKSVNDIVNDTGSSLRQIERDSRVDIAPKGVEQRGGDTGNEDDGTRQQSESGR